MELVSLVAASYLGVLDSEETLQAHAHLGGHSE